MGKRLLRVAGGAATKDAFDRPHPIWDPYYAKHARVA